MLILVIDDDELSRELLTLLLEVDGFGVVSADSGDEGLLRLREMNPAPGAVLTDLQMPGISGTELAHALRALLSPEVPIIAMSGSDSRPSGTPTGTPAGFDGFLLKPFAIAELQEVLATWTSKQAAPIESPAVGPLLRAGDLAVPPTFLSDKDAGLPLNEEVFVKMQELMPSAQLGQMYAMCIADARTRAATMRILADERDDAGYRREAHAIKGGAGMIGAAEIYQLATRAEQEGLDCNDRAEGGVKSSVSAGTSRVTAFFNQLSRACERLERILVERLHS